MISAPHQQLHSLTGLRFVAAVLVFLTHLHELMKGSVYASYGPYVRAGWVGVSLFFVLSGFVLVWARAPGEPASAFYWRRVARIYPNQVVTWALAIALFVWWAQPVPARDAALNLFLLQAWVPDPTLNFGLNGVAWSLSCEAFFYLLFPLLLAALLRCGNRRRRQLLVVVPAVAILLPLVLWPVGGGQDELHPGVVFWLLYVCPAVRLLEFVTGMLVALELRAGRRPPVGLPAAVALTVAGYAVACLGGPTSFAAATLVPFALLICVVAARDLDGSPTVLGRRAWVRLGEWSYAFYLLHQLVIRGYLHTVGTVATWPATVGAGAVLLAVGVVGSAALYTFVERPCRTRINRRLRAARASAAPEPYPAAATSDAVGRRI